MDTTTLLIIIVILLVVGGGGWYGRGSRGSPHGRWGDGDGCR